MSLLQDEGGWTPIMWATESQLVPVVNFLVSRGGDPGKKDNVRASVFSHSFWGRLRRCGCRALVCCCWHRPGVFQRSRPQAVQNALLVSEKNARCSVNLFENQMCRDWGDGGQVRLKIIGIEEVVRRSDWKWRGFLPNLWKLTGNVPRIPLMEKQSCLGRGNRLDWHSNYHPGSAICKRIAAAVEHSWV